ncbi:hypothetical protein ABPG74_016084 [Tetrahymena malaccensis]
MKSNKVNFIIKYYLERSFKLVVYPDRSLNLSVALVAIRELAFLFKLYISYLALIDFLFQDKSSLISQNIDMYVFFNARSRQIICMSIFCFGFIANLLLLGFLVKDLIMFLLNLPFKENYHFQIIFKSYNYSISPISLIASCMLLQQSVYYYIPVISIITSVLISLLVELLDYNYAFYIHDFLSKKFNKMSIFTQALECLSTVLLTLNNKELFLIGLFALIISQVTQLILLQYSKIYLSLLVKKTLTQLSLLNTFLLFYSLYFLQDMRKYPDTLLIFTMIPISIKLGCILTDFLDEYAINDILVDIQNQSILWQDYSNLSKLESFLRLINQQSYVFYQDYVSTYLSQLIENALINHQINCSVGESCFCKKLEIDSNQEDKIAYISNERNRDCVKLLSLSILNAHVQELPTKLNDFQICYYKYMQDVMGNQTFSITQLIKVQQNCFEKFNLFEIQIINRMADRVRRQIEENNNEKQESSSYTLNRKRNIKLIQQVLFDEKLSKAFYQLFNCFYQKSRLLDALNQDTINLDNLEKLGNKLIVDRLEVKKALKQLVIENGSQTQLQKLCRLYDLILDIDNYFERKISQQKQFNCLTSIPLSSKESCSVYISFSTKLGIVTKISNNFENVVPVYSNKEVIGKNINFMQPDVVAPLHNRILTNFIQKKVVSQKVADYPLLIGKDKKGFSIPYDIKIQVAMIGLEDFGCAGWIKQIKDSIHYIMTSADQGFKNFIMGQAFYELILSFTFKQSELSNIKFGNLIPLFQTLFDNNMSGKQFQTILIRPQLKEQITNPLKLQNNSDLFQELINLDLYQIQAQFIYLSTTFAKFNYLLITQCDYLDNLSSKRDALKEFRKDLKLYNQSEEYDAIDFEQLYPQSKNEYLSQTQTKTQQDSYQFLNTYNDESIIQNLYDEPSKYIVKPSHFSNKPKPQPPSKLKMIIKQNRFKIQRMYKSLQKSYQGENHQYSKIDEVQENEMTNFSILNPLNSQKQSCNTLLTNRADQYLDDAKLNDSIQIQNSQQTYCNNDGIEQMLHENSKQQKEFAKEIKTNMQKKIDKRKNRQPAQKSKTKYTLKRSNKTKVGKDQDTNVSADISFLLNQQERQKNAQGSVNLSSKKSLSQSRIQLVNKIQSSSKRHLLFYSGYILDSLLLTLVIISVSISFILNYGYVQQYQTQQNLYSDLNTVKKIIYNLLEEIHLIDGLQKNYFNLQSSVDEANFLQTLNTAKDSNINLYKNISAVIFKNYVNQQRVQDLYNYQMNYEFLSYVKDKFISYEIVNSSLLISLSRTQQLLTMFVNNTNSQNYIFQNELRQNQNQTQYQILQILTQLAQDHTQNYSAQQQETLIFIIVYSVFVFIYSILLLLFYINSFSLKQSLLSIFATIDIKKIDEMINRTNQVIKHVLDLKRNNKFLDLNNQKQEGQSNFANKQENNKNCKKKNISLTTYEQKLTVSKIIFVVVCLSFILIKPCVQYYFVQMQVDFMKITGSLQSSSEYLISAFSDFSQAKFVFAYYLIGTQEHSYNYSQQSQEQYLLQSYANMQIASKEFMDNFQTFKTSNLIQLQSYNITQIIQVSICDYLQEYKSVLQQFDTNDYQQCLNSYQASENGGFYISQQKFETIQQGIISYFNSNLTPSQQPSYLQSFFQENTVQEQFYQLRILDQISQIIAYLLKNEQQSFFNMIDIVVIVLNVFQIFLVFSISYFFQKLIFNKFSNDYQKSMQYLTLIDYEILLENPYFVSHIKKMK